MEDLKKNKLFWAVIVFFAFNLCFFSVSKFIINKTADKVIEKLQKEYSPSPYGPGLDADKVDPETLKKQRVLFELRKVQEDSDWNQQWDKKRGF